MKPFIRHIFLLVLCIGTNLHTTIYAQDSLHYTELARFDLDWDVQSLSWSPDSTKLALGMCGVEEVRIFDISSGTYEVVETQRRCATVAWDMAAGLLAIMDNSWQCNDNQILILQAQQIAHRIQTTSCIKSIQWNTDGTQLLFFTRESDAFVVQTWNVASGETETIFESNAEEERIEAVALSPDGTKLAVANNYSEDAREQGLLPSIDIIEIESGEIIQSLADEGAPRLLLQDLLIWSPHGDRLASQLTDLGGRGAVDFWDLASGEIISRSRSSAIAWHPTEDFVAVNIVPDDAGQGAYKDVTLLEIGQGVLTQLEGHEGEVMLLAWNREGTMLASTGTDRTLRIWANHAQE